MALLFFLAVSVILIAIAITTKTLEWVVPIIPLAFIFGVLSNLLVVCKNCGTPLLYGIYGGIWMPKAFPDKCPECNHEVV